MRTFTFLLRWVICMTEIINKRNDCLNTTIHFLHDGNQNGRKRDKNNYCRRSERMIIWCGFFREVTVTLYTLLLAHWNHGLEIRRQNATCWCLKCIFIWKSIAFLYSKMGSRAQVLSILWALHAKLIVNQNAIRVHVQNSIIILFDCWMQLKTDAETQIQNSNVHQTIERMSVTHTRIWNLIFASIELWVIPFYVDCFVFISSTNLIITAAHRHTWSAYCFKRIFIFQYWLRCQKVPSIEFKSRNKKGREKKTVQTDPMKFVD